MSSEAFVFAVTGKKNYLNEFLEASKRLNHFSSTPVFLVTDLSRNEIEVSGNFKIIDVKVEKSFNHHQASILLKTSLLKHLPQNLRQICYLDSDVFAVSNKVNSIFDYGKKGIAFGKDLYTINQFSPYVFNDGFLEKRKQENKEVVALIKKLNSLHQHFKQKQKTEIAKQLEVFLEQVKKNPFKHWNAASNYFISRIFKLQKKHIGNGFFLDAKSQSWLTKNEQEVLFDYKFRVNNLVKQSSYTFHKKSQKWLNKKGEEVFKLENRKLLNWLKNKHQIKVSGDESLLNGGVFVFDHTASKFFNTWHRLVKAQLKDPVFRNRDQAALFVSAHQHQKTVKTPLPIKFNFLVDELHPGFYFHAKKGVGGYNTEWTKPVFLHFLSGTENQSNPAMQFANNAFKAKLSR